MSIFDDVKKADVKKADPNEKKEKSQEAASATVGTEGGDQAAGSGFASTHVNNMGDVVTDDGQGHVDTLFHDNMGGFWHP